MNTLSVEQAIYTSSGRGATKGYQLVSKSAGIDRGVCQELCRWAPTRSPSEAAGDWTLNCFPIRDEFIAVTRTTIGGPEYSGRAMQVVTLILVLRIEQLERYAFDPLSLAHTAMALGGLRLPLDLESEPLPPVFLPTDPIVLPRRHPGDAGDRGDAHADLLDQVSGLIQEGRRVAITGAADPIASVDRLIQRLPHDSRRRFSFSTGLEFSLQRPFQLHFLPAVDLPTQRRLDSQNIVCVRC